MPNSTPSGSFIAERSSPTRGRCGPGTTRSTWPHWRSPSGPVSQAINFSDVRIQGVEGDIDDAEQTSVDRSSLEAVSNLVRAGATGWDLRDRLAELIDFDEFMRLWATERILDHWDGYAAQANNVSSEKIIEMLLEAVPADRKYERPTV